MNQKNNILKTYSGSCPIFPLPNFVMFPAVGNEFIIFEPRYLDMINYINDKEKFITMALLKSGWESDYENAPKIYNIGTLGYVSEIEEIEPLESLDVTTLEVLQKNVFPVPISCLRLIQ